MTKILIDEAVVSGALKDLEVAQSAIGEWGSYASAYFQEKHGLADDIEALTISITALRQALADAALDKMADNARELGLSYEQPVAWRYATNGTHTHFIEKEPPDDAYDEGSLAPLYTAPPAPAQEPVAHSVIAGALFDFMGWLTTRKEKLVLSSSDDASPAVAAITEFAKMRELSLDGAKVTDWNTTPQAPAQPNHMEDVLTMVEQPAPAQKPETDKVICPNCVHQFRAIPQDVQRLMLDVGFEPPFTTPPAPVQPLTDEEIDRLREANSEGRGAGWRFNFKGFARAIEAAHGITKGGAA